MHNGLMIANGFNGKTSTVAVVGLGKIGLPLAITYAQKGYRVIGCDISPEVVWSVNNGRSHIHEEPGLQAALTDAVARGMVTATLDTTWAVREANIVVIIVPVLADERHRPDFRAIDAATSAIAAGLKNGKLVIYETTLPVGTTAGRLRRLLEDVSHLVAGRDFYLAFSPERVRSGQVHRDLATYPKVVGGVNEASTDAAAAFYRSILDVEIIAMGHADNAEFVKLIENAYRDVNIALANELAREADRLGLDISRAIAAANTQPQSNIHEPGVGVGGHCIPVYPYFLLNDAPDGLDLVRQARVINDHMADYAAERVELELGSLVGRSVLVLGVAYRGDVRETAYTSTRLLQEALTNRGANVVIHDPLFSESELIAAGYNPLHPEYAHTVNAIVLQANHTSYRSLDFSQFSSCKVVLDGRRGLRKDLIESVGMRYITIGDGKLPQLVPAT
ncbi:MAG: nucleotide sugar dehydrogenase [Ktedonobacterales bacterium]